MIMLNIIILLSIFMISYSFELYQIRKLSNYQNSKHKNLFIIYSSNDNDNKNWGRPEIIPYDDKKTFAREDRLLQKDIEKANNDKSKIPKDYGEMNKVKESKWEKKSDDKIENNSNRGTGYNLWEKEDKEDQLEELEKRLLLSKENKDEDDNWLPSRPEDEENVFMKFLLNVLIDSPYDSRRKQQAKYVVRNITGFSVAIGIIFTIVWYAFPGKFISYRGDTDFTARYQQSYVDPSNLLNEQFSNSGGVYFDDAQGLPIKDPNTRVPYEKPFEVRAPPPSQEL